ncbi:MAG: hypothetical protein FJ257_04680 [Phycisphaerae bacterium]|nr:hypothetical protein [Phycisphaerae bacterium]
MHILTKILIVAVTLLVLMLVPLVMVNASNEASFKARYLEQATATSVATGLASDAQAALAAMSAESVARIESLEGEKAGLVKDLEQRAAELRRVQGDLARTTSLIGDMQASLGGLSATAAANQALIDGLLAEARKLRAVEADLSSKLVAAEQQVRDLSDSRDVLQASNNALQERLREVQGERDQARGKVAEYEAAVGAMRGTGQARQVADRSIRCKVVKVIDDPAGKLASIDAGQRDGVKEGWVLTISDGSNYVANLRIIEVDVNRSVGIVELEDGSSRGTVREGQTATSRAGE